jgi:hypothetical protein
MSVASQTADIAVLKTEVNHIKELVERNHRDGESGKADIKKDIATLAASIDALKVDLNERKGAEKLASAIRMTLAGTIGAGFVKAVSWIGALPK